MKGELLVDLRLSISSAAGGLRDITRPDGLDFTPWLPASEDEAHVPGTTLWKDWAQETEDRQLERVFGRNSLSEQTSGHVATDRITEE